MSKKKISNSFKIIHSKNQITPLIITSPHSGQKYTKEFLESTNYNYKAYKSLEDMYVNDIIEIIKKIDITTLIALYSRAQIDLNRSIHEVDENFVELPKNYKKIKTKNTSSGIGLIPVSISSGKYLCNRRMSLDNFLDRINNIYIPWHKILEEEINKKLKLFDHCIVLDIHSMPSSVNTKDNTKLADFVIGDRSGKTCAEYITYFLASEIKKKGYNVSYNNPFSGGYITSHYYKKYKLRNIQTIQIEINRRLYMDESNFEKNDNFFLLQKDFYEIINKFNDFITVDKEIKKASE